MHMCVLGVCSRTRVHMHIWMWSRTVRRPQGPCVIPHVCFCVPVVSVSVSSRCKSRGPGGVWGCLREGRVLTLRELRTRRCVGMP